eukprot:148104-Prymnesium_polylepis.2
MRFRSNHFRGVSFSRSVRAAPVRRKRYLLSPPRGGRARVVVARVRPLWRHAPYHPAVPEFRDWGWRAPPCRARKRARAGTTPLPGPHASQRAARRPIACTAAVA